MKKMVNGVLVDMTQEEINVLTDARQAVITDNNQRLQASALNRAAEFIAKKLAPGANDISLAWYIAEAKEKVAAGDPKAVAIQAWIDNVRAHIRANPTSTFASIANPQYTYADLYE